MIGSRDDRGHLGNPDWLAEAPGNRTQRGRLPAPPNGFEEREGRFSGMRANPLRPLSFCLTDCRQETSCRLTVWISQRIVDAAADHCLPSVP